MIFNDADTSFVMARLSCAGGTGALAVPVPFWNSAAGHLKIDNKKVREDGLGLGWFEGIILTGNQGFSHEDHGGFL